MSFQELDEFLLYSINNSCHNPLLDRIMITLSDHIFLAVPVILAVIYFSIKKDWKSIKIMVLMGLAIGLLDSFCTFILKENIQRLRPCKALNEVRVVHRCGGMYGYVSNHAANSFALATFLSLLSKWKYSYVYYLVAFLIALSRVYLGVHYPFDVISGAILGSLWAYLFYKLYKKIGAM